MDQIISIISSIGFGQLLYSTPTDYANNLLSDLEELLDLLGEYNSDEERLVVLIKMVSDYFLEHKTIISFENPDVILRDLMLRVLHNVTHNKVRDQNNSTILRSSIEQTSRSYHTPLPGINYPNINDNDGILTHELVPNLSPPVDSSYSNSKGDVTITERNGDAADKETKPNNSRECFTTTLDGGTSNNPGEQIATTKETIHWG